VVELRRSDVGIVPFGDTIGINLLLSKSFNIITSIKSTNSMSNSLLDHFRTRSQVDCDTLDQQVASSLGPFVDCTSNQAIAYLELIHTQHADLLKKASALAKELAAKENDTPTATLAVDIAVNMCRMSSIYGLSV